MGFADRLNKLAKEAQEAAAEHKEQVESALDKAAAAADRQTGGKYHTQIEKAEASADRYVENLHAQRGQAAPGVPAPGEPPPQEPPPRA